MSHRFKPPRTESLVWLGARQVWPLVSTPQRHLSDLTRVQQRITNPGGIRLFWIRGLCVGMLSWSHRILAVLGQLMGCEPALWVVKRESRGPLELALGS